MYILFLFIGLLVIAGVVMVTEAERPIGATYARQVPVCRHQAVSQRTFHFASTWQVLFQLSSHFLSFFCHRSLAMSSQHHHMLGLLRLPEHLPSSLNDTTLLYGVVYFVLVFAFTPLHIDYLRSKANVR